MTQAQAGERAALAELYDSLFPGVFAYARMRLPGKTDAEDVVSETFLAVVDGLPRFHWRHEGSFQAWVFQIARNRIASFYRRDGHREPVSSENLLNQNTSGPDLLEDLAIQKEARKRLLATVYALSPRRQEVVLLRYFGGLRNTEIAQVLGLDERTVSSHLSRALAELAEGLYEVQEAEYHE